MDIQPQHEVFVHGTFRGVEDTPVVAHYAKTLAAIVSNDRDVHWCEVIVTGSRGSHFARVVAHLSLLDVRAETNDRDVFLAVRDAFEDLSQKLAQLRGSDERHPGGPTRATTL